MKRFAPLLILLLCALPLLGGNRVKTWVAGETLTASDLNAEFDNNWNDVTHTIQGTWTYTKAGTTITITPASAPAANTVLLQINNTASTNLWNIDYEADVTRAGTDTWTINDATTNATTTFATISHTSTGTAAAGLGIRWIYSLEDAAGTNTAAARFDVEWQDATDASEDADFVFSLIQAGTMKEKVRFLSTSEIQLEGDTADAFEVLIDPGDPTADRTLTIPDSSGTVMWTNTAQTISAAHTFTGDGISFTGAVLAGGSPLVFEGATADAFEATFAFTDPTADRTITFQNVTGTVYVSTGTDVALADGGTNASLTASNGGIVYSDASAFALSGVGSSGQVLRSGGAGAPTWSTATYPAAVGATGTILRSDGTNFVSTTATYPATTTANELLYSTSTNVVGSSSALSYDGTTIVLNGRWQNSSTSYHVVGSASADTGTQWLQTGSFTTSGTGAGWRLNSTLTGTAGNEMYGMWNNATLVEAGSGTHGVLSGFKLSMAITAGAANATDVIGIDVATFAAAATTTNATGIRVAAPTGGTNNYAINVTSGDIFKAGTAYNNPAWVFEHFYSGKIERFADRFGAAGYEGLPTLEETERFTREHFELPQMARFKKGGAFDRGEMLLASVEENFLYDFQQNARIEALEVRVAELEATR